MLTSASPKSSIKDRGEGRSNRGIAGIVDVVAG
jgi:hypothetical protein